MGSTSFWEVWTRSRPLCLWYNYRSAGLLWSLICQFLHRTRMTCCSLLEWLSKHHSLYRVACSSAASLKTQAPWFSLAVVRCLTICNSQSSYGCKYYVHNWANPILRSTLPPISASRLGTRHNIDMIWMQNIKIHSFRLKSLVYMSWNKREREHYV